jgi:MinD superfamily P-loop ATPase
MSEPENIEPPSENAEPTTTHPEPQKCKNCGTKLETKVAAVSHDGKYQIKRLGCDSCGVQEWHVDERVGAPMEIDAIV